MKIGDIVRVDNKLDKYHGELGKIVKTFETGYHVVSFDISFINDTEYYDDSELVSTDLIGSKELKQKDIIDLFDSIIGCIEGIAKELDELKAKINESKMDQRYKH